MCDWTVIAIRVSAVDFFFFNDTATTEIYPLSLHDALPISRQGLDVARELGRANPEVLGDVVQNLAARVTARLRPPGRRARRLHRVADVLAIPFTHLAERATPRTDDLASVRRVGSSLLAPDEHLVGAINRGKGERGRGKASAPPALRCGLP